MQLDDSQQKILLQFRAAVKDCQLNDSSDEYLLKWLRIQDFHVDRAEKMLRQSLEWRQVNGVDKICESYKPSEVLTKYFSFGLTGIDQYGGPVFVIGIGRTDLKGILQSVSKKEGIRHIIFILEYMNLEVQKAKARTGKSTVSLTIIADFDQYSMKEMMYKPALEMLLEIVKTFLNNYPDSFRRAFVINAPKIFPLLFAMIKPFLHQNDVSKIKIFGTNQTEWNAALLSEINPDQLFSYYGGTQTDPDGNPKCPSKFVMGGEVPRSYYLSNNLPVPKDYMESSNIIAGASGWKKIKYKVDVPFSTLRWEFMTEGGDIGFRVYYKDSKGTIDLIPLARLDSHLVMEEGEILCESAGKYTVEFDNTFSYLRPKKLRYHIVIEPPTNK